VTCKMQYWNGEVKPLITSNHCGNLHVLITFHVPLFGDVFCTQASLMQDIILSGRLTVLNATQENELAEHIRNLAAAGFPCDRRDVKNLAYDYAMKNGITGFSQKKKCWLLLVQGFISTKSNAYEQPTDYKLV